MWGCINQDISSTAVQISFPTSFSSTKYGMALSWFDYNNNIGVKLTETASSYFKVVRQSTYGTKKSIMDSCWILVILYVLRGNHIVTQQPIQKI